MLSAQSHKQSHGGEFGWGGVFSYIKSIPTHEKIFPVVKSGPNATVSLIFLGLGWPWVGEFVGFIIISRCFPTQQNLVYRKHPINSQGIRASRAGIIGRKVHTPG